MKDEMISIIVPVYNAELYLQECIDSILDQTYQNFELILVDDGSADNSLAICESYRIKSDKIVVVHQNNAGVSAARNKGLSLVKGEYFCFVDADDSIESVMIESLYTAIKKNEAELSICGFKCISSNVTIERKPVAKEIYKASNIAEFVAEHYLEWLISSPWGKLYKNIKFPTRNFDTNISLGEDLKFNIQYFEHIEKIVIINDCLYRYKEVEDSLTKTYKKGNYTAICDIYETTIQYFKRTKMSIDAINLKNVNYKLFSFCISFMSQNMLQASFKESLSFINQICNNELLQQAIYDLPDISFTRKMYVWGIAHKFVMWLWLLSSIKLVVRKYIR